MLRVATPCLILVLLAGGCSRDAPQTPAATASRPIPADPSATEDVPGAAACHALVAAVRDATLMNPGVVDGIATTAGAADAPLADAAERLAEAYRAAMAARGTDQEPDLVAAVSVAGADMTQVCTDSGLETVG
ncbi:MAG TPA: hypothetical protein VFH03_07215 [Actinoplanes sp.]|nr:hypothetical protein [Actinoplanes sp.]